MQNVSGQNRNVRKSNLIASIFHERSKSYKNKQIKRKEPENQVIVVDTPGDKQTGPLNEKMHLKWKLGHLCRIVDPISS